MTAPRPRRSDWLRRGRGAVTHDPRSRRNAASLDPDDLPFPIDSRPLFANPFTLTDLDTLDDATLRHATGGPGGVDPADLARCAAGMPLALRGRLRAALPVRARLFFERERRRSLPPAERAAAARRVLDALFWELTYFTTPDLYEQLTEGERIHPGIFARLTPYLHGETVLDAGAGSGRAGFACVQHGAATVYAVEPSDPLLRILTRKAPASDGAGRIVPLRGRFDALPLADASVGVALACSSFTAEAGQGGDAGLAELTRVTRPGGRIVVIWPRVEDHDWLAARGFRYEAIPLTREMTVRFRSLASALRCARRFYARRREVFQNLLRYRRPDVPFSVLGFNPPHDYCWLLV